MKRQKRLFSLVLAIVMLFTTSLIITSAADPTVVSTESAKLTSSYKMFKVSPIATVNTLSDGTKTLEIIYPGSSFIKMYLGTAADAATATTGIYDAEAMSDGRYKYTIPMPASGDTITAAVRSSSNNWKDVTLTISSVTGTENVKVSATYSMFKVLEDAKLNTYSDGSKALEFVYNGTKFLQMYLGTKDEAAASNSASTDFYSAKSVGGTYVYTIPVSSDAVTAVVRSTGDWKDNTLNIVRIVNTSDATVTASYSMFKIASDAKINTYSDGSKELEFYYKGSSFTKLYLGTAADAETATTGIYDAVYISDKNYKYTIPMPASGNTITAAVRSSKNKWWDNTITVNYVTDTKDVNANIKYDVFSINQDVTLDVYYDGSMKGAIKYPDSSITKAYLGTAADAQNAAASDIISISDGKFIIPVSALDTEISVAVYNGTSWVNTKVTFATSDTSGEGSGTGTGSGSESGSSSGSGSGSESGSSGSTSGTVTPNIIPTDGTYTIDVASNASMFKVDSCKLNVKNGKITATVTLSGTGYDYMYNGTAANAAKADSSNHIKYVADSNGKYTFTFDIPSLDKPIDLAAQSAKNDKWFDRQLTFDSSTLRLVTSDTAASGSSSATNSNTSTGKNENLSASEIENMMGNVDSEKVVSNGTYTPSFGFTGGSGKTNITCDKVVVKDGKATAAVVFDSQSYTWVQVDGVKYYNQNEGGNSTFIIPINLNGKTPITAETVAMSAPHEVAYTLYCFIDGTKVPASVSQIEETTEAEDQNAATDNEKTDENSWGAFDSDSSANNEQSNEAGSVGIASHIVCIIIIVLLSAGIVILLVSKKKRG